MFSDVSSWVLSLHKKLNFSTSKSNELKRIISFFCFSFSQLYIGLTTGLCGSLTTYSGVMFYSCVALFGPSKSQTYPISNYLSVLVAVLSSSFVAFLLGRDLSICCLKSSQRTKQTILLIKDHVNRWIFPLLISFCIPLLILLAVLLPQGPLTYLIYSVIFSPFGSLTRYFLSVVFNGKYPIPVGTLIANLFGSLLYFGLMTIKIYVQIRSFLVEQILLGLLQGYCGCLTTVSTLIAELESFEKPLMRYIYLFLTIVPLQVIYIVLAERFSHLCRTN